MTSNVSDAKKTTTVSITAEEAARELVAQFPKIVTAEAFFHEGDQAMVISVWVSDMSVMMEVPTDSENKFKGFEIIWGRHIPDGMSLQ